MALSVQELQTMRDDLVRARAKGVRELQLDGQRVRYGSDAEMRDAIMDIEKRIRAATAGRPSRKLHFPNTGTGFR